MTDDEDDFVQQALRADAEKECRVLGEMPKPQNVLRALHLCFKYDLEVPAWVKQEFQDAYRSGVVNEANYGIVDANYNLGLGASLAPAPPAALAVTRNSGLLE